MSEFKREARYIVVKPDCEDSLRTERLKSYIDEMCFKTPDCIVVEADWPEYEPVWRMIESRVMGLPDELECAQSELAALREELAGANRRLGACINQIEEQQQRLADAERRNAELESKLHKLSDFARFVIKCVRRNGEYAPLSMQEPHEIETLLANPTESGASE